MTYPDLPGMGDYDPPDYDDPPERGPFHCHLCGQTIPIPTCDCAESRRRRAERKALR